MPTESSRDGQYTRAEHRREIAEGLRQEAEKERQQEAHKAKWAEQQRDDAERLRQNGEDLRQYALTQLLQTTERLRVSLDRRLETEERLRRVQERRWQQMEERVQRAEALAIQTAQHVRQLLTEQEQLMQAFLDTVRQTLHEMQQGAIHRQDHTL